MTDKPQGAVPPRRKMIMERIRLHDEAEMHDTEAVRRHVLTYLKEQKGYADEDIETGRVFEVKDGTSSVDFIIKISGRRLVAIKCVTSSIDSRERHILAFSRVVDEHLIPLSVVTDAETTKILDTASGRLISEDIRAIPSRAEINLDAFELKKCPEERRQKEQRILLAFETVSCRTGSQTQSAGGQCPQSGRGHCPP